MISQTIPELPPEVEEFIESKSPALKDAPLHFVGRKVELNDLLDVVSRTMNVRPNQIRPPGQMMIAAPGAGKTSLMVELAKKLRAKDVSVIRVKPRDIINPVKFNEAVLRHSPWRNVKEWRNRGKSLATVAARVADATSAGAISALLTHFGMPPALGEIPLFASVVDQWLRNEIPTTTDVLKLLQHADEGGCVLIIDEAQDMADHLSNEDCKVHMHEIVEYLGIPDSREALDIERATVFLAGLSNTLMVVEEVGTQGIEPHALAPLPTANVREMINQAILAGANCNSSLTERAQGLWTEAITSRYGDWTRIAQAGSQAVQHLLKKFGKRMVDEAWGWVAIQRLGDRYRERVYDSILRRTRAEEHAKGVGNEMIDVVTQTLDYNGNRVIQHTLQQVVESALSKLFPADKFSNLDVREQERTRIIQRMLRSGLLDRTDHLPTKSDRHPQSYYCPIPSLLRYTTEQRSPWHDQIISILTEHSLQHREPSPNHERFHPKWHGYN